VSDLSLNRQRQANATNGSASVLSKPLTERKRERIAMTYFFYVKWLARSTDAMYFPRKFLANKLAIASSLSTLKKTYKTRRRSTGRYTGETGDKTPQIQYKGWRSRKRKAEQESFLARFWGWRVANNVTTDIELQLFLGWISRMSPYIRTFTVLGSVSNTRGRR